MRERVFWTQKRLRGVRVFVYTAAARYSEGGCLGVRSGHASLEGGSIHGPWDTPYDWPGLPHDIREFRSTCREPPGTARRRRYRGGLRVRETCPLVLVYVRKTGSNLEDRAR